jgi:hypothetical protein
MNPKTGISNQIMFGSDSPIPFGVFPKAVIWDLFHSTFASNLLRCSRPSGGTR